MPVDPSYEVFAVRYATVPTSRSEMFLRFEAYGEPDAPIDLDFYFWVLRDSERGRHVLVDTGAAAGVAQRRGFRPPAAAAGGPVLLCDPLVALADLGVEPVEVSDVVVSHLHWDHIGNVGAFPRAQLHVPERELRFWQSTIAARAQLAEHVEQVEVEALAAAVATGRCALFDGPGELVPGVVAIPLLGHSPGHTGCRVATEQGQVVLAVDAIHFYEELELDRPFNVLTDLPAMYESFDVLRRLRDQGLPLVAGHDPSVARSYPPVPGAAGQHIVRIA